MPDGLWTWDETRDLCMQAQKFTEDKGDKKIGWGFGVVKQQHDGWCDDLFRNFGADVWDETGQKIILKDEKSAEATAALEFARGAWEMGLLPRRRGVLGLVLEQQVLPGRAVHPGHQLGLDLYLVRDKQARAGRGHRPGGQAQERARHDHAGLRYTVVMPKVAKEKGTAAELIKAVFTKEIYAPWLEMGFVTNVVHEYDTLPMWTGKRAKFNEAAQSGVYGGFPAPYDNVAMAESGGPNDPVGTMTVRVLIDGWEPARAIEETDTFVKGVFAKYF